MADTPVMFIAGFQVEYLNGDNSYVVTVAYKDSTGMFGDPDKFSFSSAAKLKKFIGKSLLVQADDGEEVAAEVTTG